ncbi:MAG TPA: hypothetical protein VJ772_01820, partial [Nitrososphaeraceae archaeon]|nr:hypothetical protein [Nitrososphaeraceae archaeon]
LYLFILDPLVICRSNLTNPELTTIQIKKSTRNTLKHLARKDENYDDLINQLLKKEVTNNF